ncbi:MAG: hypothetical protein DRP08_01710 [Candidatus Aenigmatarchaeota archaeon]|nr:MAG: hypothetical protein DRP08_01710 [Candidatus Aenigmarchaeota archaeon]
MSITKEELALIVRNEVRKVMLEAFIELIPYVDPDEEDEIEEIAGEPSNYKIEDFVKWNGK